MLAFTGVACVCLETITVVENLIINRSMEGHLYLYIKGHTIWSLDQEDGEPWSAAINCCCPWSTLSSGLTDGCVILWCLKSVVSAIIIDLVSFGITRWQR